METADQWVKRIAGSWNRKSRGLEGETAGECEKRDRGLKVGENRGENAGSKSKVHFLERG